MKTTKRFTVKKVYQVIDNQSGKAEVIDEYETATKALEYADQQNSLHESNLETEALAKLFQPYDVLQIWKLDLFTGKEAWLDFSTLRTLGEFLEAIQIVKGRTHWQGKFRVARRGNVIFELPVEVR